MEEHIIFGTHHTEALRLIVYRAHHTGLQHHARLQPRAPRPGEPVVMSVWSGPDLMLATVQCVYTIDGSEPTLQSAAVTLRPVETVWDSLVWGYRCRWEAELPAQPAGTWVRYAIVGHPLEGTLVFADWPPAEAVIIAETRRFFGEENAAAVLAPADVPQVFGYSVGTNPVPAWAAEARFYHVFVDRFAPAPGAEFASPETLSDFFGGTLAGVTAHLDYIAELGCNTLWLSPIFPSPTHHGYDVTDYQDIEPRLGTLEDLRALLAAAHAREMRIVLDIAFNHCSDQHPLFQQALADPDSPYRDWFHFDMQYSDGYRSYFGVPTMPEWNLAHAEVRAYLIAAARFWLQQGVDGFRLDYADGPGPAFWTEFGAACRAVNPDVWLYGEIVQPPDVLAPYQGRLDGTLDFLWAQQVRRAVAYGNMDARALAAFWEQHGHTRAADYLCPVFLDNHDMDRFLLAADNDPRRVYLGLLLLYLWPHPPVLYYGTEIGLRQQHSSREPGQGLEVSRVPMVWASEQQDHSLREAVRALNALRQVHPALIHGAQMTLQSDEQLWVFTRQSGAERYIVAINLGTAHATFMLEGKFERLWTAGAVTESDAMVHLAALSAAVWCMG